MVNEYYVRKNERFRGYVMPEWLSSLAYMKKKCSKTRWINVYAVRTHKHVLFYWWSWTRPSQSRTSLCWLWHYIAQLEAYEVMHSPCAHWSHWEWMYTEHCILGIIFNGHVHENNLSEWGKNIWFLCAFRSGAKPVIENRYYCCLLHNERTNNVKKKNNINEVEKWRNKWTTDSKYLLLLSSLFSVALYLLVRENVERQRTRRQLIYIILLVLRRPDTVALNICSHYFGSSFSLKSNSNDSFHFNEGTWHRDS